MNITYHKIALGNDFWDSLNQSSKKRILQGLEDADKGNFSSAKEYMRQLLEAK